MNDHSHHNTYSGQTWISQLNLYSKILVHGQTILKNKKNKVITGYLMALLILCMNRQLQSAYNCTEQCFYFNVQQNNSCLCSINYYQFGCCCCCCYIPLPYTGNVQGSMVLILRLSQNQLRLSLPILSVTNIDTQLNIEVILPLRLTSSPVPGPQVTF